MEPILGGTDPGGADPGGSRSWGNGMWWRNNHPTSYEALHDFYAEQDEELYLAGEDMPGMV